MGHCVEYLDFSVKTDKKKIQAECDRWGDYNCDLEERGGFGRGLGHNIKFTDRLFDSYDDAIDYLKTTVGNYRQTAVKYYRYPEVTSTKTLTDLQKKGKEYTERINKLSKPHYQGVKQATVKCKCCGSSLATKYCGQTFENKCPVCCQDLRPQSVLDKYNNYRNTLYDIRKRIKEEEKKINSKQKTKAEVRWLVCCEVHH